jgi:ABC-type transporter Mla maintaining outer membrane lipid asymmetry ATPase subunit MlaF
MNQTSNIQRIQSGSKASTSLRRAALNSPSFHPFRGCHRPFVSSRAPTRSNSKLAASQEQANDEDTGLFYPPSKPAATDNTNDNDDDDEEPDALYKINSSYPSNDTSTSSATMNTTSNTNKNKKATNSGEEGDVLIEFKDVHKSFGSKKILRGASFKIRRGEAVGIIGSSGTGKSTTLRLAAGLLQPDSGEVLVKGEARQGLLSDDDTSDKLKVGLVFQSGALFDSLTVKQNVGFMLYEHSDLSDERIEAAVASSLSKVGLSGVENLYPSELSGGMKKRVALARAIVTDTTGGVSSDEYDTANGAEQLIMYDEPTAGLDPVASTVIEDLIRNMHDKPNRSSSSSHSNHHHHHNNRNSSASREESGDSSSTEANGGNSSGNFNDNNDGSGGGITSYVVVTHQHSTIRRAVDKIIFLHDGKVVWEGSVEEFDTTDEPIVRQFASGSLKGPIVYV